MRLLILLVFLVAAAAQIRCDPAEMSELRRLLRSIFDSALQPPDWLEMQNSFFQDSSRPRRFDEPIEVRTGDGRVWHRVKLPPRHR